MFRNIYNYKDNKTKYTNPDTGEVFEDLEGYFLTDEKMVDEAGYRPPNEIIMNLLVAGERLESTRRIEWLKEQNAYFQGLDDAQMPITDKYNISLIDSFNVHTRYQRLLKEYATEVANNMKEKQAMYKAEVEELLHAKATGDFSKFLKKPEE